MFFLFTSFIVLTLNITAVTNIPSNSHKNNLFIDEFNSILMAEEYFELYHSTSPSINYKNQKNKTNSISYFNKPFTHTNENVEHDFENGRNKNTQSSEHNKHHESWAKRRHHWEHHRRHGPHFDDVSADNTSISAMAGHSVHIDCRVSLLRDKTVSWVRRKLNEPPILLTVGDHTYTGDSRFSVQFKYPGNWRLHISPVNKTDEGVYECQVSTHPPTVIRAHLIVEAPEIIIVDEFGSALKEKYYEEGSTLQLRCVVKGTSIASSTMWWLHGTRPLHRDAERGGIAVKTDASKRGFIESTLRVGRLSQYDAGNYTCALPPQTIYTVLIHVLNEESLGELQQVSGNGTMLFILYVIIPIVAIIITLVLLIGVS